MPATKQTSADASGRKRLMDAAVNLYGAHGLDGVSLRQITIAAGSANNYAVQYHFGNESGLIDAILKRHMPEIEEVRARLLSKLTDDNLLGDTRSLVDAMYRPLINCGRDKDRAFAKFILELHRTPKHRPYANDVLQLSPIAGHIVGLIRTANPAIAPALFPERVRLIAVMVLTSITSRRPPFDDADADEAVIDNAIDMATAALITPVSASVSKMLQRGDGGALGLRARTPRRS
jgi:AcrR family transcriptional regulator